MTDRKRFRQSTKPAGRGRLLWMTRPTGPGETGAGMYRGPEGFAYVGRVAVDRETAWTQIERIIGGHRVARTYGWLNDAQIVTVTRRWFEEEPS